MATTHFFAPLAFETLGPISSKAFVFLKEQGYRFTLATDGKRETMFLFQKLSGAMQKYN